MNSFHPSSFNLTISAPEDNLRRLLMVRGLFLLTVCAALMFCYWQLALPLSYHSMLWIISGLTLINIITLWQLRYAPKASELNFFGQLLVDIVGVSSLLFFVGGADNPFVSYYLVPLCIAAATLSWRYTWPLVTISLGLYTLLFFYRIPLPDITPHHQHDGTIVTTFTNISLHTIGMWINFLVSALLISYFVVKMADTLRRQDAALGALREDRLRDEQLMAVATLAAGTAHELGTPLTTIKTLLSEMKADYSQPNQLQDDLSMLQNQVAHCSNTLKQLTQTAGQLKDGIFPLDSVENHFQKIVNDWMLLRPEISAHFVVDNTCPEIEISLHPTIIQSITNLLNNAADANPVDIELFLSWNYQKLELQIQDCGTGMDEALLKELGKTIISAKGDGRGLGLLLTQAAVTRHGGSLSFGNRPQGGTEVRLTLPITDFTHTLTKATE